MSPEDQVPPVAVTKGERVSIGQNANLGGEN